MKKVFVSGSTGYIGSRLCLRLAEEGIRVHALYRSEKKAEILRHPNIQLFKGDILQPESLAAAVKDCEQAYHVAAFASVWTPDPSLIYHLNIDGAMNVIRACRQAGVKRIVLTSTAGVLGSSEKGVVNEESVPDRYFVHYEHSKAILENVVRTLVAAGTHICIVNPSRVYGPGILSESNGVTRMINKYQEGKWRVIPGNGKSIGNYVYIDDVVEGHILAMEKGRPGERYILGGENISYNDFFSLLAEVSGKKYRMFHLPLWLMLAFARMLMFWARLTGKSSVMITHGLVKKFSMNFELDGSKARGELGYEGRGVGEGVGEVLSRE